MEYKQLFKLKAGMHFKYDNSILLPLHSELYQAQFMMGRKFLLTQQEELHAVCQL